MVAPAAGLAILRRLDEADGGLGRHADVLVAGHPVRLAQGDRRQGVGVHLLRRAGRKVAVGLLMPHEPEQARRDRSIVRLAAGLVRFAVRQKWEQAHGGRGGVGVDVAGAGAGGVFAPLHIVLQAPTAVGGLMPREPLKREADSGLGGMGRVRRKAAGIPRAALAEWASAAGPRAALSKRSRPSGQRSRPGKRWAESAGFPGTEARADVGRDCLRPAASVSAGQIAFRADGFDRLIRRLVRRRLILDDRRNLQRLDVRGLRLWLGGNRHKFIRRRANRPRGDIAQQQQRREPRQVEREAGRVPNQFVSHPIAKAIRPRVADRAGEFFH